MRGAGALPVGRRVEFDRTRSAVVDRRFQRENVGVQENALGLGKVAEYVESL